MQVDERAAGPARATDERDHARRGAILLLDRDEADVAVAGRDEDLRTVRRQEIFAEFGRGPAPPRDAAVCCSTICAARAYATCDGLGSRKK